MNASSTSKPQVGRTAPETKATSRALPARRSAAELRRIATALEAHPIPTLTKKEIAIRWSVGADTVRKTLRACGVDPGTEKCLGVPLTDLLFCEGIDDPLAACALGSDADRQILKAGLETLADRKRSHRARTKFVMGTYRRKARDGAMPSILIGVQHRFRPTLSEAEAWHGERGAVPK